MIIKIIVAIYCCSFPFFYQHFQKYNGNVHEKTYSPKRKNMYIQSEQHCYNYFDNGNITETYAKTSIASSYKN